VKWAEEASGHGLAGAPLPGVLPSGGQREEDNEGGQEMMSMEKERVSVTLTKPYLDALDLLVRNGIYIEGQSVARAALRLLMRKHRIPLFYLEAEE